MRRKICMICSIWHEDYIRGLLEGIRKRMDEDDIELHIFASYDIFDDDIYRRKTQEVFTLPNVLDYDGILIASNSEGNYNIVQGMIDRYLEHGKKVLSVEQQFQRVPYIGVDNYTEFYCLVEHMLKEHNCKTVNYLGGPASNIENQERYRAFCDCMKKYGVPIEEERVLHKYFLHLDGNRAYAEWKEKSLHLPDAVICANDNMALGYCNAASEDGYNAPKDFLITGFDNFEEGQYFCPSITSVNRNWVQLGYESMDKLLHLIDTDASIIQQSFCSHGRLAVNESCGCGLDKRDLQEDFRHVYYSKTQEEALEVRQRISRQELSVCTTLPQMQQKLKTVYERLGIEDMAFCINHSLFEKDITDAKDGYDENICVITKNSSTMMPKEKTTDIANLNLQLSGKDNIYIIAAMHLDADTYGYGVAPYYDSFMKYHLHRTFMEAVSLILVSIRQRENLNRLNARLQELYVQDPMTGLYNRFGYMNQAQEYLEKHSRDTYLIYLDMDNLKVFNDKYGHGMGDKAIKGMAQVIREVFAQDSICVRMGGDEFLVMDHYETEDEVLRKEAELEQGLEEFSVKNDFPVPIRTSIGHISSADCDETLEILVKMADDRMYEVKQEKKKLVK